VAFQLRPVDYVQNAKPRTMPRLNYMLAGEVSRKTYSPVLKSRQLELSERLFHSRQRPDLPSEHKPVPDLAG
jgi:hypothetical protein